MLYCMAITYIHIHTTISQANLRKMSVRYRETLYGRYIHTYSQSHTHTHTYTHTHIDIYTYMHTCIHKHIHTHTHTHIHIQYVVNRNNNPRTYVCVYMYVCMYVCQSNISVFKSGTVVTLCLSSVECLQHMLVHYTCDLLHISDTTEYKHQVNERPTCMYVCMYVCMMFECVYVCGCLNVFILHLCVCMYVYVCMYDMYVQTAINTQQLLHLPMPYDLVELEGNVI